MNQTQKFLEFLRGYNGQVLLGDIMKTHFACEYRKHISLLRRQGHAIKCVQDDENPSNNLYILREYEPMKFEASGQRLII